MTSGDGTITTRGFFRPAAAYNPSIAGIILSGSIGSVRIAIADHSRATPSSFNFSSGVIPPVAFVAVLIIAIILSRPFLFGDLQVFFGFIPD
jgi:hypothetical protein